MQYRARVTTAPVYGHCSVAGVWAERGRRRLDQPRQDMADSRAAPNVLENEDWGRGNGVAQNQHSMRREPPVTQSRCASVDPLHTGRETQITGEGTQRHEGTGLQIPVELLELALSIIQKLLSVTSSQIKKVFAITYFDVMWQPFPPSGFCLGLT